MGKTKILTLALALVVVVATAPATFAGGIRSGPGAAVRPGMRSGALQSGRTGLPGMSRSRGSLGNALGSSRGSRPSFGPGQSGRSPFDRGGMNRGNPGDLFRNAGNYSRGGGWGYPGSSYRDRDSMAKAYRDVGIAHAIVGLAGVVLSASQQHAYATAPPGYWQRQAVVVQPQRYEQYREWIPELYDARTGQKLGGGYYENRTRLVPEVIEYRDVWIAH